MILNLILVGLVVVTAVAGWRMSTLAYARGRREAELEAAPLKERADDLSARLAAAETRVENAEKTFRELQGQKGAFEATANRVPLLENEIAELRMRLEALNRELAEAGNRNAGLEASLHEIKAREPEMKALLEGFLREKGENLAKHNTAELKKILDPLNLQIQEFKGQIQATEKDGNTRHGELREQITNLLGMNRQLSLEAQNLTTALKGENKKGGNWGEIILERVLEMSGLEKGREYEVQQAYANEEGRRKLPDAVIHLPEKRQLIIDSKLSLVAYDRYCSAETPDSAATELLAHVASVRQHVRNLADQRYQDLPGLRTPDFVFLFMPIEPAFIVAVKQDSMLFQEAFDRNIIIVSPSTLLATLRTVANIWKQEYRHKHVLDIADQAGALYDKFVGFLDDLKGVGDNLTKAQDNFTEARKKLKDGTGNLVGRVEKLRKLGAKAKKAIPGSWLEDDESTEESPTLSLDEPAA
jgi:DNA recombination protein RmuC